MHLCRNLRNDQRSHLNTKLNTIYLTTKICETDNSPHKLCPWKSYKMSLCSVQTLMITGLPELYFKNRPLDQVHRCHIASGHSTTPNTSMSLGYRILMPWSGLYYYWPHTEKAHGTQSRLTKMGFAKYGTLLMQQESKVLCVWDCLNLILM